MVVITLKLGLYRVKLGNGEHLSLEAYKYKENNIYVFITVQHKEHVKFYPEHIFIDLTLGRQDLMTCKRKWRRSPLLALPEVIANAFWKGVCKVAEF